MHLYPLSQQAERISTLLDLSEGEITPEIEQELEGLKSAAHDQADGLGRWIRQLQARVENDRVESDFFSKRKRQAKKLLDRLCKLSHEVIAGLGSDRLTGDQFTLVSRQAGTPTIEWIGEGEIPEGFRRVKVELDGDAAHKAYRDGSLPDGFRVTYSRWLQVQ